MLKISIIDTRGLRKLVVEGKLIAPWTTELHAAWSHAREDLDGRKLVIDLNQVTAISREGEDALSGLIQQGAKFTCGCVFTRHVLKGLVRRQQRKLQGAFIPNER
jgi:hypothetical protein